MELKQLYREIVNEHNLHPVHKGKMENPDLVLRGVNPSCGDDITLQLKLKDGVIEDGMYDGSGCAISQASVDMMVDQIIGKKKEEAIKLAGTFMGMIKGDINDVLALYKKGQLEGDESVLHDCDCGHHHG